MHTATIVFEMKFDIDKLIKMVNKKKLPIKRLKIKTIKFCGLNRSRRTGFRITRYNAADISYPLLVIKDQMTLVDGRHRLFKMIDMGRTYVNVIFVSYAELHRCLLSIK